MRFFLLMPSPSADSKFVLSIPKIFKHTQFFNHTQNVFSIFKSGILLHKLYYLSILKTFWEYFKNLSLQKNLSILKENFGSADGLGKSCNLLTNFFSLSFVFLQRCKLDAKNSLNHNVLLFHLFAVLSRLLFGSSEGSGLQTLLSQTRLNV